MPSQLTPSSKHPLVRNKYSYLEEGGARAAESRSGWSSCWRIFMVFVSTTMWKNVLGTALGPDSTSESPKHHAHVTLVHFPLVSELTSTYSSLIFHFFLLDKALRS